MIVQIILKSLGKRGINPQEWKLSGQQNCLRDLITDMVRTSVSKFNDHESEVPLLQYLTNEDINQQSKAGKIGFGTLYDDRKGDPEEAIRSAIMAYEDGLYRVFVNEEEILELDEPLHIRERDQIVFVRLTMLAGRLW